MIPLRDKNRSYTFPAVNTALIAINVLIFFYELSLGQGLRSFLFEFGLVPANVSSGVAPTFFDRAYPFFSSMFLHGGWFHLIGNMLYLYIFGDNVEDRLGHFNYLAFYLLSGLGAAISQIAVNPSSEIPMVGASGAISGVLGAYVLFFPHARVVTLVPIFYFIQIMEIPAFFFLLIWFLMQFLSGVSTVATGAAGAGVAWWAHIGGFVTGLLLASLSRKLRI